MKQILDYLNSNPWIYAVIYEVVVRLIPTTSKYYSLIALVDRLWPNLKKGGGLHVLIFMLCSFVANAQLNYNARTVRFTPVDTATLDRNYQVRGAVVRQTNTDSLYMHNGLNPDSVGRHWILIGGSGGGGSGLVNFANNGLILSGDTVQLGNDLKRNTFINTKNHNFEISNDAPTVDLFIGSDNIYLQQNKPTNTNVYSNFFNDNTGAGINIVGSREFYVNSDIIGSTGTRRFSIDSVGNVLAPNSTSFKTVSISGNSDTHIYETPLFIDLLVEGNTYTSEIIVDTTRINLNAPSIEIQPNGSGGTNGQFLKTDGTGKVSWANVSATPAGSDTQIQFNNSSAFGASHKLTFTEPVSTAGLIQLNSGNDSVYVRTVSDDSHTAYIAFQSPSYNGTIQIDDTTKGLKISAATDNQILIQSSGTGLANTTGNIVFSNSGATNIIVMKNLPTGCASHPTGTLWNNAGVLSICP